MMNDIPLSLRNSLKMGVLSERLLIGYQKAGTALHSSKAEQPSDNFIRNDLSFSPLVYSRHQQGETSSTQLEIIILDF